MASIQKFQTGKRLYGLGSRTAPNRGQVSAAGAQGYLQREMRRKNMQNPLNRGTRGPMQGGDGKSDRRSGIAAQMLKKKQIQTKKFANGGSKTTHTEWEAQPKPSAMQTAQDAVQAQILQQKQKQLAQQAQQPPAIKANENGILELPYNQQYSEDQYAAVDEANQQLLALKQQGDDQALEYGQQKRGLQQGYEQNKAQTLNRNAAGGTAFSSMYGTGVANNATQFANDMGALEQGNTNFLNNSAAQRAAIQNSLNQQLGLATQRYGDALGGEAGTLGYGQAKTKVTKPKAAPGKKPLQHQGGSTGAKKRKHPVGKKKHPVGKGKPKPKKFTEAAKKSLKGNKSRRRPNPWYMAK